MSILSILHLLLCATFLGYLLVRVYRLGSLTLFHLTSISYTATALLLYPFVSSDRWAIVNDDTVRRGFFLAVVFIGCCTLADLVFYRRSHRNTVLTVKPTALSFLILAAFFVFGFWGFLRYFFVAGAWSHFGEVFTAVRSGTEYYDAREGVAAQLMAETGKGVAHGTTAVYIIVPVVVAVGLYVYRLYHRVAYLLLAAAAIIQALLTVSISMERAPMLFAVIFPVLAWAATRFNPKDAKRYLKQRLWKALAVGTAAFVAVGLLVYSWTDVGDNPLTSMLARIFMSPCITANYYLAAFPDVFPFRGWSHIWMMGATAGEIDPGTRDIANFVTLGRYDFNPNSGMLSTAYTGAGLAGCLVVTLVYLLSVITVDRLFRRYSPEVRNLNLLINLYSLPMLANAPFLGAIASGFVLPSLLLFLYLFACRRHLSPAGQETGPTGPDPALSPAGAA